MIQFSYRTSSLFTGDLLTHFLADLQALRADLKAMSTPSSETRLPTVELTDPNATAEVEAYAQRIGLPMLDFALGTIRTRPWTTSGLNSTTTMPTPTGEGLDAEVLADGSPVKQLATAAAETPGDTSDGHGTGWTPCQH